MKDSMLENLLKTINTSKIKWKDVTLNFQIYIISLIYKIVCEYSFNCIIDI